MTSDELAQVALVLLTMLLVLSALAARRLSAGTMLRLGAIWVLIFGAGFLMYALGSDFRGLSDRLHAALDPASAVSRGGTLRVPLSPDGHYWVRAKVNGTDVRFLVDSGATVTALSPAAVAAAGIVVDGGAMPVMVETANGLVHARRVTIATLEIGPLKLTALPALTAGGFGEVSVLGMSFLSGLRGWGVERGTLILRI